MSSSFVSCFFESVRIQVKYPTFVIHLFFFLLFLFLFLSVYLSVFFSHSASLFFSFYSHLSIISYCTIPLTTYQVQISSLSKYKSHSVFLLLLSFIHYFLLHHSSLDLPSPDIVAIEIQVSFCFSPSTLIYPLFPTAPFLSRLTKSRYRLYRNTSLILFFSFYSHLSIISYCTIPLTTYQVQISSLSKYKSHSVFLLLLSFIHYFLLHHSSHDLPSPDIVAIEIQVSFCFFPSTLIYPLFPTAPFLSRLTKSRYRLYRNTSLILSSGTGYLKSLIFLFFHFKF